MTRNCLQGNRWKMGRELGACDSINNPSLHHLVPVRTIHSSTDERFITYTEEPVRILAICILGICKSPLKLLSQVFTLKTILPITVLLGYLPFVYKTVQFGAAEVAHQALLSTPDDLLP